MEAKKVKKMFTSIGLIAFIAIFFGVVSQFYSSDEQIFITDNYFIKPKSQPLQFVLMWFANIFFILLAIFLGRLIAVFLWTKGLLFLVVGIFLIMGAALMGYVSLYLQSNVDSTAGLIVMSIIILFIGGLGVLMLFTSISNRKKS